MSIALTNVSKWYGNIVAVNDVSFTLSPGVTGLLGPNGAGKSTILHMLVGLLRPSAGTATIAGKPTWQNPEIYKTLGFVPESESVYSFLTGYELVRLNARLQKVTDVDTAVARAIDLVEMGEFQHRSIATYSKGLRQRAKIAAMLVHEPTILLLDEPFNGMDPKQRLQMMAVLRRLADAGSTILVSSHILEEVDRLADTVLVIVGGRLAASGSSRVIRQLMTDRPHTFTVRTSDDRLIASSLIKQLVTASVEVTPDGLSIRTTDLGSFTRVLPVLAREAQVSILEVHPTDESLESVFSYLVQR